MAMVDPEANDWANQNEPAPVPSLISEKPSSVRRLLQEHCPPGFHRKVIAETIATYLLVFVTSGSATLSASNEQMVSKLRALVAGGMIVTVMIYVVGHISGAHMNPAVTLAFSAVPEYVAAQLRGAISAAFTLWVLLDPIKHVRITSPTGSDTQVLTMEIVVTFSMMFITSAVATDTKAVST